MASCWTQNFVLSCSAHILNRLNLPTLVNKILGSKLDLGSGFSTTQKILQILKNYSNDLLKKTFVILNGRGLCKTTTIWLRRRLKIYVSHVALSTTEARCSNHSSCFLHRRLEILLINFIFCQQFGIKILACKDAYLVTFEVCLKGFWHWIEALGVLRN